MNPDDQNQTPIVPPASDQPVQQSTEPSAAVGQPDPQVIMPTEPVMQTTPTPSEPVEVSTAGGETGNESPQAMPEVVPPASAQTPQQDFSMPVGPTPTVATDVPGVPSPAPEYPSAPPEPPVAPTPPPAAPTPPPAV